MSHFAWHSHQLLTHGCQQNCTDSWVPLKANRFCLCQALPGYRTKWHQPELNIVGWELISTQCSRIMRRKKRKGEEAIYPASLHRAPPGYWWYCVWFLLCVGNLWDGFLPSLCWEIILHIAEGIILLDEVLASVCVAHIRKSLSSGSVAQSESPKVGGSSVLLFSFKCLFRD